MIGESDLGGYNIARLGRALKQPPPEAMCISIKRAVIPSRISSMLRRNKPPQFRGCSCTTRDV
jgi:hypothetical protein